MCDKRLKSNKMFNLQNNVKQKNNFLRPPLPQFFQRTKKIICPVTNSSNYPHHSGTYSERGFGGQTPLLFGKIFSIRFKNWYFNKFNKL